MRKWSLSISRLHPITFTYAGNFHSLLLTNNSEFSCKWKCSSNEKLGKKSKMLQIFSSVLRKVVDFNPPQATDLQECIFYSCPSYTCLVRSSTEIRNCWSISCTLDCSIICEYWLLVLCVTPLRRDKISLKSFQTRAYFPLNFFYFWALDLKCFWANWWNNCESWQPGHLPIFLPGR